MLDKIRYYHYNNNMNNTLNNKEGNMQVKCFKCGYQWTPRTDKPKSCPECKARLKDKIIIIKEEEK